MSSNQHEPLNFIMAGLKEFVISFPQSRVRYEFDVDAKVHCVEVLPNHLFHSDNGYISWENEFTDKFINSFPNQNICFFTDDALVGIREAQFELCGVNFGVFPTGALMSRTDEVFVEVFNTKTDLFFKSISTIPTEPFEDVFNKSVICYFPECNLSVNENNASFSLKDHYPLAA